MIKSFDILHVEKLGQLKQFCQNHNPPISLQVESHQSSNDQVRIIAETDVKHIAEYDDYFYLLEHGTPRPKHEKTKEIPIKWYQFWK